jgi:ATP-dependent Clp protease protease subunit
MESNKALLSALLGGKGQFGKPKGFAHEFYLNGTLGEADDYLDWFDTIRHANENDDIIIHINSPGGNLFTAIQLMNAMAESEATITAQVEGACMSAATMIMLCCDRFMLSPHAMFMFHNYSGGTIGKGGEMWDNMKFERSWSKKFLHEVYDTFLTKREIDNMLDGKDIWLAADEVAERLKKRQEKYQKLEEEEMAEMMELIKKEMTNEKDS